MAAAEAQVEVEYWCHHCNKRVSVESVGDDESDLICSDCKFGFVESMSSSSSSSVVPVIDVDDDDDDVDDVDQPTLGSQFLQVLRLLAQVSNDDNSQPPVVPQQRASDPDDLLGIHHHHHPQEDDDEDNDDDDDGSVHSVEIEGDSDDEEDDEEEEILRRQRRELLRVRLRDLAIRARSGGGRNRILDWADILMGLDNHSNPAAAYVGNPGDYVNEAEYEAVLQNLAETEGRRGAPPASKASVEALKSLHIMDQHSSFVCAVCKEFVSVGDSVKELPCAHSYHTLCILPWLSARNTCPVCRFQLPTDDPDYDTTTTSSSSSSAPPPF